MPPAPMDMRAKQEINTAYWGEVGVLHFSLNWLHGGGLAWGIIAVNHRSTMPCIVKICVDFVIASKSRLHDADNVA